MDNTVTMFKASQGYNIRTDFPLCADLDGTLVKTDILVESLLALLKSNPFYILLIPLWLLKGRAYLKQQIASHLHLFSAVFASDGDTNCSGSTKAKILKTGWRFSPSRSLHPEPPYPLTC